MAERNPGPKTRTKRNSALHMRSEPRLLSPFQIHCGNYSCIFNGYGQRTGAFRESWLSTIVRDKIEQIPDEDRRDRLLDAHHYLFHSADSSYSQFIMMQLRGERRPFLYEIHSAYRYRGVECALWPALYFRTSLSDRTIMQAVKSRTCIKSCPQ